MTVRNAQAQSARGRLSAPAQAEMQTLLGKVSTILTNVASIERDYSDGSWDINDTQNNFRDMSWPLRNAQSDTPQRDVSSEGWRLDNLIGTAERNLRDFEREMSQAAQSSRTVNQTVNEASQSAQALRGLLGDRPELQAELDRATASLNIATQDHRSADTDAQRSQREANDAERELGWSDTYVWRIRSDRPGQDVSSDARFLGHYVDRGEWDVRDSSSALSFARNREGRAAQGFAAAEAALKTLQSKL